MCNPRRRAIACVLYWVKSIYRLYSGAYVGLGGRLALVPRTSNGQPWLGQPGICPHRFSLIGREVGFFMAANHTNHMTRLVRHRKSHSLMASCKRCAANMAKIHPAVAITRWLFSWSGFTQPSQPLCQLGEPFCTIIYTVSSVSTGFSDKLSWICSMTYRPFLPESYHIVWVKCREPSYVMT